jgi:hypothetical protein
MGALPRVLPRLDAERLGVAAVGLERVAALAMAGFVLRGGE